MTKIAVLLTILTLLPESIYSQERNYNTYGKIIKYSSKFSAFPHPDRINGHNYDGIYYDALNHYSDSTVAIFIPEYISTDLPVDLVFYFHGWWDSIDTSLVRYNLLEQFYKSKINGILILPEVAKNSADSFGGRLEEKHVFKNLVFEIIDILNCEFGSPIKYSNITLAGHSGAYQVISYILLRSGITDMIDAVYLFDGLFADLEKFTHWIDNYKGRFINIYTLTEGTKRESENLILCLDGWDIPFLSIENDDFGADELRGSRIIIIKSELDHNDVIHTKNQFQKFLESSF